MSGLPPGWTSVSLATLCERIVDGSHNPPKPSATGRPMLSAKNVHSRKIHFDEVRIISEEDFAQEHARTGIVPRDVLLTIVGTIGRTAVVPDGSALFALQRSVAVLRSVTCDPRYLAYNLESPVTQAHLADGAKGTAQKGIYLKALGQLKLDIAPLAEQKRIADKLDTVLARVDACRERLDRVPALLKRFRQSVLAAATSGRLTEDWRAQGAAFGHDASRELKLWHSQRSKTEKKPLAAPDTTHWNHEIPTGWAVASVHQFAECLDRLRVPIKREDRKSAQGLYPYYGANGEVSRIDEYIFDDELVLVTEDETFYGREKPIAYRTSGKCWVNNHAHVLRASSPAANDYLCYALMYYDVIPWLSGTTGRAKLTQQALNSLPIAVPPEAELIEITRRVASLLAFVDRLEAGLTRAKAAVDGLTPALLAKAFRGELVPQDPNDEPAEEMLKRLAKQGAGQGNARKGTRAKRAETVAA